MMSAMSKGMPDKIGAIVPVFVILAMAKVGVIGSPLAESISRLFPTGYDLLHGKKMFC